jgi:D-alanine transfer protein
MDAPKPDMSGEEALAPGPVVSRRAALRLAGLAAGGVVATCGLAALDGSVPAESSKGSRMYDYAYLRDKYKSPSFAVSNMLADSILAFGSSEFKVTPDIVPQVPRAIFGNHDHGLDLWFVGEGYDQSLWHAIAFGAYAAELDRGGATGLYADGSRKAVFIVSPQWFFEGGVPANATRSLFSYNLWHAFCRNPRVSTASVDYAARRLVDMGVDSTKVWAATHNMLPDSLNDVVFEATEAFSVRRALEGVRSGGESIPVAKGTLSAVDGVPAWDDILVQALLDGEKACTTNDYYIYDNWWTNHNASDYAAGKLAGFLSKRSFLKAPTEDADLDCALTVATDVGLDLLVVLIPCSGPWYDYEGMSTDDRARRYELIRQACSDHGTRIADLSGHEYDPYFTCDGSHLGWTGWVAVERAIYEFAKGE